MSSESWGKAASRTAPDVLQAVRAALARLGEREVKLLGMCAVVLTACVLGRAWHAGQHGTPDSATYLNAAAHLAAGDGYVTSRIPLGASGPAPVTVFAPGFSSLVALGMLIGLSARGAAELTLWISYVGFAALSFWILARCSNLLVAFVGTLGMLFHPAVLRGLDAVLSDLPAAVAGLTAVALVLQGREPSLGRRVALGLTLSACFLLRWASIVQILAVGLAALCVWWPGKAIGARVLLLVSTAIGVAVPSLAALLRNQWTAGQLMGQRRVSWSSPWHHLQAASGALRELVGPPAAWNGWAQLAWTVVASLAILAHLRFAQRQHRWRSRAVLIVAATYGLGLVVLASAHGFDPLDRTRFWLFVPPLLLGGLLPSVRSEGRPTLGPRLLVPLTVVVLGSSAFSSMRGTLDAIPRADRLSGSLVPPSNVLREALSRHDAGSCFLASNEERFVLPHSGTRLVARLPTDAEDIRRFVTTRMPLCVVLFERGVPQGRARDLRVHRANLRALEKSGRAERVSRRRGSSLWRVE